MNCMILDPKEVTNWNAIAPFIRQEITKKWDEHLDDCEVHAPKMPERVLHQPSCFFCKHFSYVKSTPAYSDVTAGDDFEMRCNEGKWSIEGGWTSESDAVGYMASALNCESFELSPLAIGHGVQIK